jgi:hypothetical protein
MEQRVDEVRAEEGGNHAAEGEVEHDPDLHACRPARVERHQDKRADPNTQVDYVEHWLDLLWPMVLQAGKLVRAE